MFSEKLSKIVATFKNTKPLPIPIIRISKKEQKQQRKKQNKVRSDSSLIKILYNKLLNLLET